MHWAPCAVKGKLCHKSIDYHEWFFVAPSRQAAAWWRKTNPTLPDMAVYGGSYFRHGRDAVNTWAVFLHTGEELVVIWGHSSSVVTLGQDHKCLVFDGSTFTYSDSLQLSLFHINLSIVMTFVDALLANSHALLCPRVPTWERGAWNLSLYRWIERSQVISYFLFK